VIESLVPRVERAVRGEVDAVLQSAWLAEENDAGASPELRELGLWLSPVERAYAALGEEHDWDVPPINSLDGDAFDMSVDLQRVAEILLSCRELVVSVQLDELSRGHLNGRLSEEVGHTVDLMRGIACGLLIRLLLLRRISRAERWVRRRLALLVRGPADDAGTRESEQDENDPKRPHSARFGRIRRPRNLAETR
jgi:hypothetical protein